MDQYSWLGVPVPEEEAAWAAYIKALRDNLFASWQRARGARLTLQSVRQSLGLPFMAGPPVEGAPPDQGAWNSGLEQDAIKLQAIVALSMKFADECLQDKRKLIYNVGEQSFGIELLPSDDIRIADTGGVPQIVNAKTGQPENITGNIEGDGSLGIAPIIFVAGAVGLVATGIAVYYTADRLCKTLESLSEDKTMRTLATKNAELVLSGKATPAEAKALTDGIYKGASELHAAKAKEEETAKSPWHKTIQTVAFVGLGIAGVYLVAQLVGRGGGRSSAPARAANPNPTTLAMLRAEGIEIDHHESDLYVRDTPRARAILKERDLKFKTFRDSNGDPWLDVPFAYEPFWEGKRNRNPRVAEDSPDYGRQFLVIDSDVITRLTNWTGSQGSATYSLASRGASHPVSPEMLDEGISELESVRSRTKGRKEKRELSDLIGDLDTIAAYPEEHSYPED